MTDASKSICDLHRGDRVILEDRRTATITRISYLPFLGCSDGGKALHVRWLTEDGEDGSTIVSECAEVEVCPPEPQETNQ